MPSGCLWCRRRTPSRRLRPPSRLSPLRGLDSHPGLRLLPPGASGPRSPRPPGQPPRATPAASGGRPDRWPRRRPMRVRDAGAGPYVRIRDGTPLACTHLAHTGEDALQSRVAGDPEPGGAADPPGAPVAERVAEARDRLVRRDARRRHRLHVHHGAVGAPRYGACRGPLRGGRGRGLAGGRGHGGLRARDGRDGTVRRQDHDAQRRQGHHTEGGGWDPGMPGPPALRCPPVPAPPPCPLRSRPGPWWRGPPGGPVGGGPRHGQRHRGRAGRGGIRRHFLGDPVPEPFVQGAAPRPGLWGVGARGSGPRVWVGGTTGHREHPLAAMLRRHPGGVWRAVRPAGPVWAGVGSTDQGVRVGGAPTGGRRPPRVWRVGGRTGTASIPGGFCWPQPC